MSRPTVPEHGSDSVFTLPPIRSVHATPRPVTQLPPTPSTVEAPPRLPPLNIRQDPSLTTPVQPRTRQLFPSSSSSTPVTEDKVLRQQDGNIEHDQAHSHGRVPNMTHHHHVMTPMTVSNPHKQTYPFGADEDVIMHKSTRHQTPCPRPSTQLGTPITDCRPHEFSSVPRKKQDPLIGHRQHATPVDTPLFNSTYPRPPLKTPVSALSTRTMGRSISTPTLPMGAPPFSIAHSAPSTHYSPSSDSQQSASASVSRVAARGRAQMSYSSSPTPSSPTPIELAGIQPPAPFPGSYPHAYTRKDPVPTDEGDHDGEVKKSSGRQGAPSWNPWDYVLGEVPGGEQGPGQTPVKDEDGKGNKVRRRFTKRELEALEVLWSISKSPSKYERQRLGAWLGVKTKHITVWFQNRRQEEKRYLREGAPVDPPPPSRSNRGTFDPVTGKWRPVPLSCISGLQPPPEEKSAVVRSISVGDLTRDMYFAQHPHTEAHLPTPTPAPMRSYTNAEVQETPVPKRKRGLNSLEDVLQAREDGFASKQQYRRGSREGSAVIKGEGQERIREILALMPSDPPSMDLSEIAMDDESDQATENEESPKKKPLGGTGGPMGLARMLNAPSGANAGTTALGRASSLDILASSSKAKHFWKTNNTNGNGRAPLGAISTNIPNGRQSMIPNGHNALKRSPTPSQGGAKSLAKRARIEPARPRPAPAFRHKDSFSRSQSSAVLESPEKDRVDHGEMKTPGFTRSFSISSAMSEAVAITPESAVVAKKENIPIKAATGKGKTSAEERDAEVLGAAEKLLQLLGGA
ncbi:hypothetical protein IAU60_003923 [Kwoniella sp. DSM 27419]